jgi:hypothetical protein
LLCQEKSELTLQKAQTIIIAFTARTAASGGGIGFDVGIYYMTALVEHLGSLPGSVRLSQDKSKKQGTLFCQE